MAASNLRRLTSDHADLHTYGLPPHYLFPPSPTSQTTFPDDLTNLTILLTGPQGTPFSQGLWRVHLKIPHDYPKNPPKASFRTRIWHPNVEETTGAVCVDTLKRDWEARLTLRDVLITISCLLIHPNPDSALNSAAGSLLQDDYEEFARQARLMTSIHAPIPADLKEEVTSAKRRGDDAGVYIHDEEETDHRPLKARKAASAASVVMKKQPTHSPEPSSGVFQDENISYEQEMSGDEDQENDQENDPSLSPSLVTCTPPSPRRSVLGKRPLSVLSTSTDPDIVMVDINDDDGDGDGNEDAFYTCNMTSSEKNIAANNNPPPEQRKPPAKDKDKSSIFHPDNNNSGSSNSSTSSPFSSFLKPTPTFEIPRDEDIITKENHGKPTTHTPSSSFSSSSSAAAATAAINTRPGILKQKQATTTATLSSRHTLSSKITKPSISATARGKLPSKPGLKPKPKPRIGVRRL